MTNDRPRVRLRDSFLPLAAGVVAALLVSPPGVARADGQEPFRQVDRPLTHVQGTLNLYAGLDTYVLFGLFDGQLSQGDTAVGLHAGVELGIVDDLTIGALVFPLQLSPDTQYGDAELYGLYRFVRGTVEVAGSLGLTLPTLPASDPVLSLGIPVRIHVSHRVRVDTEAVLSLSFGDQTTASLGVPLSLSINPVDRLLFGANTGLRFPEMDPALTTVPLGVALGYTVGKRQAPFADLWVHFAWPALVTPGLDEVMHPDIWQLSLLCDSTFDLDF